MKTARITPFLSVTAAVIITLSFTACDKPDPNDASSDTVSYASESIVSGEEKRITKDYSEYFHADVTLPDVIPNQVDILYAKPLGLSERTLVEHFFGKDAPQRESDNSGSEIFYRGKDGSYLNISTDESGTIHYSNVSDFRVKLPTENFGTKNDEIMLPDTYIPRFNAVYQHEELTGFPRERAIAAAISLFRDLGISVSDDIEVYAIDHRTMQEYVGSVVSDQPDVVEAYEAYETVWTYEENDDFYVLGFSITANGLPITHRSYVDPATGSNMPGSYAEVRVGRNGITRLDMSCPWTVCGAADTVHDLVSPEYAIDKVFREFDAEDSQMDAVVTDIALEYIAIPCDGEDYTVLLVLVWDVTLAVEFDAGEYIHKMYSIDAFSGEVIGKHN